MLGRSSAWIGKIIVEKGHWTNHDAGKFIHLRKMCAFWICWDAKTDRKGAGGVGCGAHTVRVSLGPREKERHTINKLCPQRGKMRSHYTTRVSDSSCCCSCRRDEGRHLPRQNELNRIDEDPATLVHSSTYSNHTVPASFSFHPNPTLQCCADIRCVRLCHCLLASCICHRSAYSTSSSSSLAERRVPRVPRVHSINGFLPFRMIRLRSKSKKNIRSSLLCGVSRCHQVLSFLR